MKPPVRNLYILLCYAWNCAGIGQLKHADNETFDNLIDLLAKVLVDSFGALQRRGLYRKYRSIEEESSVIRGRIQFNESLKRFLFQKGHALCSAEDYSEDTTENQIIKSTIKSLLKCRDLDKSLGIQLKGILTKLSLISDIEITSSTFVGLRLDRLSQNYHFPLLICEFIFQSQIPSGGNSGETQFKSLIDDEKMMRKIFESFVFNFFRIEGPADLSVKKESFRWRAKPNVGSDLSFLPTLNTDVSLISSGRKIILETKFVPGALKDSHLGDKEIFRSNHLNQLFSYLSNAKRDEGQSLRGILLYPSMGKTERHSYDMGAFNLEIATVDLNRPWAELKSELLRLVA